MATRALTASQHQTSAYQEQNHHEDLLIAELQHEVNQLRQGQANLSQLQDQIQFLQQRNAQLESDKNKNDHLFSQKLCDGMSQVSQLVAELDELRAMNIQVENDQIALVEQLTQMGLEHERLCEQAESTRQNVEDSKRQTQSTESEVRQLQALISEQKRTKQKQMSHLDQLRTQLVDQETSISQLQNQIRHYQDDINLNNLKSTNQSQVLSQLKDNSARASHAVKQSFQQIQDAKYELKQLDEEICYFEEQNRKHAAAQSQLRKAFEFEMSRSHGFDNKLAEYNQRLAQADLEAQRLQKEKVYLDQQTRELKHQNEQQQNAIAEMSRHMKMITQQNYELSNELQRFLQTDEVLATKLNKRSTLQEIREKVDTAIQRSIKEVEQHRGARGNGSHSPLRISPKSNKR